MPRGIGYARQSIEVTVSPSDAQYQVRQIQTHAVLANYVKFNWGDEKPTRDGLEQKQPTLRAKPYYIVGRALASPDTEWTRLLLLEAPPGVDGTPDIRLVEARKKDLAYRDQIIAGMQEAELTEEELDKLVGLEPGKLVLSCEQLPKLRYDTFGLSTRENIATKGVRINLKPDQNVEERVGHTMPVPGELIQELHVMEHLAILADALRIDDRYADILQAMGADADIANPEK